ncbi:MAG: serine--tRNA ligase [candidate division WOR-3 bacterium]
MISREYLREKKEILILSLKKRNYDFNFDHLFNLDKELRELKKRLDDLNAEKNEIAKKIGEKKRKGENIENLLIEGKKISKEIEEIETRYREKEKEIEEILLEIPNIPHESVPVGKDSSENVIVREWGEIKDFAFEPKPHWELGEKLGILEFKKAGEIAGSRFLIYKEKGALLERALINFFLDLHTKEHGYKEIIPPFLLKPEGAYGSGHLPKFDIEMYKTKDENLYLLPTAEMALANLHRDEILEEDVLPLKYVSYTPCFRREAGSYGKDVRGMIRVHQFNKVELFKFTKPEESYDELEKMVNDAEKILQLLNIPYRVVLLCTGDLGFAASKTYDIEAWAPGVKRWLEVSSVSNCEDFQARRTMTRFRRKGSKKIEFVHTLNGSGLALPRTFIALIENYQDEKGRIHIPERLIPYMNGIEIIE